VTTDPATTTPAPPTIDLPVPGVALAIGAHPDDIEFGCGATIAKWSAAGCAVHLLVLTDGSKGTWDPDADPTALAAARADEQAAAARALGAASVHRTGFVDGELSEGPVEQAAVCAIIRDVRPDVVLGHDPWKRYRLHPDHRHAGFLVLDAVVAARDPHFFPEQRRAPHRPTGLLLFESEAVDHLERVESTFAAKVDALLAHRSQWRSTMGIDGASPEVDAQTARFVQRLQDEADAFGALAGIGAAEGFKRITDV
jgi:LmbE family N-acetylglucosaminyl deacetylase